MSAFFGGGAVRTAIRLGGVSLPSLGGGVSRWIASFTFVDVHAVGVVGKRLALFRPLSSHWGVASLSAVVVVVVAVSCVLVLVGVNGSTSGRITSEGVFVLASSSSPDSIIE